MSAGPGRLDVLRAVTRMLGALPLHPPPGMPPPDHVFVLSMSADAALRLLHAATASARGWRGQKAVAALLLAAADLVAAVAVALTAVVEHDGAVLEGRALSSVEHYPAATAFNVAVFDWRNLVPGPISECSCLPLPVGAHCGGVSWPCCMRRRQAVLP